MSKKFEVEYSNLICHFGQHEMLEMFEERFLPALELELPTSRGETYLYKFIQIGFSRIDGDFYLHGRLLQRMNLKARQRLSRSDNLVYTDEELQSDPTSIFLLRLHDHKLFVIPEQPRSPKSKTFQYVLLKLLQMKYMQIYREEKERFLAERELSRLSKELRIEFESYFDENFPEPDLKLNPIGASSEVDDMLEIFAKVKTLKLEYHKTNNEDYELDEELITKFGQSVDRTNSDKAVQEYRNNNDGLNIEAVENLVKASTQTGGNCNFIMTGVSETGEKLTRTEEHTKIKPKIETEPTSAIERFGGLAARKLAELVDSGEIKLANIVNLDEKKEIARRLFNRLRR